MAKRRGGKQGWLGACALLAAVFCGPAHAESAYGCADLLASEVLPAVEGRDGQFFLVDPDLMSFHDISEESIAALAKLSETLAARGTRLIYVPMPTKSTVLPDALPEIAAHLQFDPNLALAVYERAFARLSSANVLAVDARRALRTAHLGGASTYFGPDPRLTPEGGQALATAISQQIAATGIAPNAPATSAIVIREADDVDVDSLVRLQLQQSCRRDLPDLKAANYRAASNAGLLSGSTQSSAPVVFIGSQISGHDVAHVAGFLRAQSGVGVTQFGQGIRSENAFAAMADYLTSDDFQSSPPGFLVWENPVWFGLGDLGPLPLAELTLAAGGKCDAELNVKPGSGQDSIRIEFADNAAGQLQGIMFDTDARVRRARFSFESREGLVRSRTLTRAESSGSKRFFMPMQGFGSEPPVAVDITVDATLRIAPRVFACSGEGGR